MKETEVLGSRRIVYGCCGSLGFSTSGPLNSDLGRLKDGMNKIRKPRQVWRLLSLYAPPGKGCAEALAVQWGRALCIEV
jgi:hypothetical protein